MELFGRRGHHYYKELIPSKLTGDFIFCFGSNSTGDHGPVTVELALKHFGAQMVVASGRQGQSYGSIMMILKKGATDPRRGIQYDKHFLMPTQMKSNFKDLYNYAKTHSGLTFVVVYTMHKCGDAGLGAACNACGDSSTQLSGFFGSCEIWGVPCNVVFEGYFNRVVRKSYQSYMKGYSMLS